MNLISKPLRHGIRRTPSFPRLFPAILVLLSFGVMLQAGPRFITNFAGDGTEDFDGDGGPATDASFYNPSGLAFDSQGNCYIADTRNHRIRRIDAITGIITTIAGTGVQGYSGDGALASAATFRHPGLIVIDASDNIYVNDALNYVIRKIDSVSGNISTIVGINSNGNTGDDGPATSAKMGIQAWMALDSAGNLFFCDTFMQRVRRVDAVTGVITRVVGVGGETVSTGYSGDGGPALAATFQYPRGIAVDTNGDLYIADTNNQAIRKVDSTSGDIETIAGTGVAGFSGDGGQAALAQLSYPLGIKLDGNGNLIIAEGSNHRLRNIDLASGIISTIAGTGATGASGDGGPAVDAVTGNPFHVECDEAGNLYFSSVDSDRVRRIDPAIPPQPDLLIGKGAGRLKGNNLYQNKASGPQILKVKGKAKKGKKTQFYFSVQNDSTSTDTIRLKSSGLKSSNSKYKVAIFRLTGGKANVTNALKSGAYTAMLAPDESILFRYELRPKKTQKKASAKFGVVATSQSPVASRDACQASLTLK